MTDAEKRAAFEAWTMDRHDTAFPHRRGDRSWLARLDGKYVHMGIRHDWSLWLAALAWKEGRDA